MPSRILIAALALGSVTVSALENTQLTGLTLTNGLSSLTDTSSLNPTNLSLAVGYLTDNDLTTFATNIGNFDGGSLQGTFAGATNPSATGIYIIGISFFGNTLNGPFSVSLLTANGLTSSLTYDDSDFVLTSQLVGPFDYVQAERGQHVLDAPDGQVGIYAYLHVAFSDFNLSGSQVLGIKLSDFNALHPDIAYIGAGYAGSPIPEPSTYGLMLGGLVLVAAALRRRTSKHKA